MRIPVSATIFAVLAVLAVALPAGAQTPADPATLPDEEWIHLGHQGGPTFQDRTVAASLHWDGLSRQQGHPVTWVEWRPRLPETVPGDTAQYSNRYVRQRFDCAGRRWRPLAVRYDARRTSGTRRVGSSDAQGPWTPADTTGMVREMFDLACLPADPAMGMGLPPLNAPERWTRVAGTDERPQEVDTAGRQRHGEVTMMWSRTRQAPRALQRFDGTRGPDYDTHHRLMHVECATRRVRIVRQVLAHSGTFVDSLTRPGPSGIVADSSVYGYAEVNAACGGPPPGAPTSLRAPSAPGTAPLALWQRAVPGRTGRRGRKRRRV
jgi:hypothetical protein